MIYLQVKFILDHLRVLGKTLYSPTSGTPHLGFFMMSKVLSSSLPVTSKRKKDCISRSLSAMEFAAVFFRMPAGFRGWQYDLRQCQKRDPNDLCLKEKGIYDIYHIIGVGETLYLCKLEVLLRQIFIILIVANGQGPTMCPAQEEEGSQDTRVHLEWLRLKPAAFPQTSTFAFIGLQW